MIFPKTTPTFPVARHAKTENLHNDAAPVAKVWRHTFVAREQGNHPCVARFALNATFLFFSFFTFVGEEKIVLLWSTSADTIKDEL